MNEVEFNNLDFYGKLQSMDYICWDVKRRLESISDKNSARKLINELMDILEENFIVYAADAEFNKEENFGNYYRSFSNNIKDVLELAPLIKRGQANYSYVLIVLSSLMTNIEETLPKNIRLARFIQSLSNCSEEIAGSIGIDEVAFTNIMGKMLDNVDIVNDILTKNGEIQKRSTR